MNKIFGLSIVMFMAVCHAGLCQSEETTSHFAEKFTPVWQRAEGYLLAVAAAMPEEEYDFKPTPEVFSFGEQMMHLVGNLFWLNNTFILNEKNPSHDISATGKSKAEILNQLKEAFSYITQTVKNFPDSQLEDPIEFNGEHINKEYIFYLMRDHLTHHRAQAIMYLRLKGIAPPKYVGW